MDSSGPIVIISIIGLLVWIAILHAIIAGASRSKTIEYELKKQTVLLAKIAQRDGVPDDEINNIINPPQKKKSIW